MSEIEKLLGNKYQINVRGENIRSSTLTIQKQINLILEKEHYKPEEIKRKYIPSKRFQEKKIIVLDKKISQLIMKDVMNHTFYPKKITTNTNINLILILLLFQEKRKDIKIQMEINYN